MGLGKRRRGGAGPGSGIDARMAERRSGLPGPQDLATRLPVSAQDGSRPGENRSDHDELARNGGGEDQGGPVGADRGPRRGGCRAAGGPSQEGGAFGPPRSGGTSSASEAIRSGVAGGFGPPQASRSRLSADEQIDCGGGRHAAAIRGGRCQLPDRPGGGRSGPATARGCESGPSFYGGLRPLRRPGDAEGDRSGRIRRRGPPAPGDRRNRSLSSGGGPPSGRGGTSPARPVASRRDRRSGGPAGEDR